MFQYLPFLHAHGFETELSPLLGDNYLNNLYYSKRSNILQIFKGYFKRMIVLLTAFRFDLLWIEKELFPGLPAFMEGLLGDLGVKFITDFDDAIFHNYDVHTKGIRSLNARKIDQVMRRSRAVLCGNRYLAQRASASGAPRTEVLPTVIDLDRYHVAAPRQGDWIVVGWIGSPSTAKYLELVLPSLRLLAGSLPIKLLVIGAEVEAPGLDTVCLKWSEDSEAEAIRGMDIGIMPLVDSPWERGKCGYKLIQYMASGLPVVASPVGVNPELVEPEGDGLLATTPEEWTEALGRLARDPELRLRMGQKGREKVEQFYCLQVTAPRLAALFRELAGPRPGVDIA